VISNQELWMGRNYAGNYKTAMEIYSSAKKGKMGG
jgi:hypothetical protein